MPSGALGYSPMFAGSALVSSMLAGSGYWWSNSAHREELRIAERVKELEASLGPNFANHKAHVEKFFGMADTNQDGELTVEEIEAHMDETPPSKGDVIWSKSGLLFFVCIDFVIALLGAVYTAWWKKSKRAPMHGKGKLGVTIHCIKNVAVSLPTNGAVAPATPAEGSRAVKFQPVVSLTFNNAKSTFDTHPGTEDHKKPNHLELDFTLKKPLNVDFDLVNPKAKDTDPQWIKFPMGWFHLEVMAKTEKGNETLGSADVDIAEFVKKSNEMTIHLGDTIMTGICRRRAGKFGELTISGTWTPDNAAEQAK